MKKAAVKNILVVLMVFAIATMTACNLATPANTGSNVEVVLGGIGNQGGKSIGSDASYVSIKVMNSSGVQVGSGTLTQNEVTKVWKGTIHVTTNGQMTFKAIAGIVAAQVDWLGEATYNVGLDTVPLTITVDAPGVTTGLGNGYGPAGGKIFFDKEAYFGGWRYLEAAPSDQSTSIAWSNITDTATGFMGMSGEFGTGQANTTAIVGQVVGEVHCTAGAAYLCDNLTFGGYSDWFLPSREDLRQMYMSKDSIGGFSGGFGSILYWSSTESTPMPTTEAMAVNFSNNIAESQAKVNLYYLRAVRAF